MEANDAQEGMAAMMALSKDFGRIMDDWARAFKPIIEPFQRIAEKYRQPLRTNIVWHRLYPRAIPPYTRSPWRLRYERRTFGRELTPGERIAHNERMGTWPKEED